MDKQFILNAIENAYQAIYNLERAMGLEYCVSFKFCIGKAADHLENAAAELRAAEAGER